MDWFLTKSFLLAYAYTHTDLAYMRDAEDAVYVLHLCDQRFSHRSTDMHLRNWRRSFNFWTHIRVRRLVSNTTILSCMCTCLYWRCMRDADDAVSELSDDPCMLMMHVHVIRGFIRKKRAAHHEKALFWNLKIQFDNCIFSFATACTVSISVHFYTGMVPCPSPKLYKVIVWEYFKS